MKCPHCSIEFHEKWSDAGRTSGDIDFSHLIFEATSCPACKRVTVRSRRFKGNGFGSYAETVTMIYPQGALRSVPAEVPALISEDFLEAVKVLPISPKASAALSRRNLQAVLREAHGIKRTSLSQEIDDFLTLPSPPSGLKDAVDAIRNVGNFAAHPTKSDSTGMIVGVEPHEAEWLLDVLEMLFDFTYVQPTRTKAKRDALNAKLADAKKPPMK